MAIIDTKIKDNNSTIHTRINDCASEVKIKSNCSIDSRRLEALIDQEAETRAAKDDDLQEQIDEIGKSTAVSFITVYDSQGTLDEQELELLAKNKVNRLVYNNIIYYLAIQAGNVRKYFSRNELTKSNELDINMTTGDYVIFASIDLVLDEHIKDTVRHITQSERNFWNNKVSAEVKVLDTNDYNLLLKTD